MFEFRLLKWNGTGTWLYYCSDDENMWSEHVCDAKTWDHWGQASDVLLVLNNFGLNVKLEVVWET